MLVLLHITHFRGCNGIGDLLTREARNFIYSVFIFIVCKPLMKPKPKGESA